MPGNSRSRARDKGLGLVAATVSSMNVGWFCGSTGPGSSNAAALRVAMNAALHRDHVALEIPSPLTLPAFTAAESSRPPPAVVAFQKSIRDADVVLIAAPEYAAGLAGSTKNALDWLVGDATLYHTLVGVLSAGTTGGAHAIEQLVRTLSWQGALPVATLGITAPRTKSDSDGTFTDPVTISQITRWTDTVINAASGTAEDRRARVTETVSAYGIDPARFGTIE